MLIIFRVYKTSQVAVWGFLPSTAFQIGFVQCDLDTSTSGQQVFVRGLQGSIEGKIRWSKQFTEEWLGSGGGTPPRMQWTPPWIIIFLVGNPKKKTFKIARASKWWTAFLWKNPDVHGVSSMYSTVSCGLMGREGSFRLFNVERLAWWFEGFSLKNTAQQRSRTPARGKNAAIFSPHAVIFDVLHFVHGTKKRWLCWGWFRNIEDGGVMIFMEECPTRSPRNSKEK